ncbi:MAG: hypothetical protein M5U31_04935 [Acidimicrobiia bacterium]|nr:hypothetical protein [Acidimicrobiia bacterium]
MLVRELRERHVELHSIAKAIAEMRDTYGDWPLTAAHPQLLVPRGLPERERSHEERAPETPTIILVEDEGRHRDVGAGHETIVQADDLEMIAHDLERGGWAARELPDLKLIEVDPDSVERSTSGPRDACSGRRRGSACSAS